MVEMLAALSWLELGVAGLTILGIIGGVMKRAFLTPIQADLEDVKKDLYAQDQRLRVVEHTQAEHGVEISTVKDVTMKLVDRMDRLLGYLSSKDKE